MVDAPVRRLLLRVARGEEIERGGVRLQAHLAGQIRHREDPFHGVGMPDQPLVRGALADRAAASARG